MTQRPWAVEAVMLLVLICMAVAVLIVCARITKLTPGSDDAYTYRGIDSSINWDNVFSKYRKIHYKCENKCREALEKIFGCPFPKSRPPFLKSPRTGQCLELDCYNKDLNLALEYNGIQHRKYHPWFHRSPNDFIDQVWRDKYKRYVCARRGINLITVPDTVPYSQLPDYVYTEAEKLGYVKN